MPLKIITESESRSFDGLINLSIILIKDKIKKAYRYTLGSAYALEEYKRLLRRRQPGRAINFLKKNDINKEKEVQANVEDKES